MTALAERLLARTRQEGDCLIYTGYINKKNGYGYFTIRGIGTQSVHRMIYEELVGPITGTIDHVKDRGCLSKACINVEHLEDVTLAENIRRARPYNRRLNAQVAKTHCPQNHEYTPENTKVYRGSRYCLTCHNEETRRYKARKRAEAR